VRKYLRNAGLLACLFPAPLSTAFAQTVPQLAPPPKVHVFFSLNVEADHVPFATAALQFFAEAADKHAVRVEATSNWADMNDENLAQYKLVVWLNGTPPSAAGGLSAIHGWRRRMARLPRRGL
jgi:hypothetical protein